MIKGDLNMSNPIISSGFSSNTEYINATPMTINGTINKLFIMFTLLLLSFVVVWNQYVLGYTDKALALTSIGAFVGFVIALIISFIRKGMYFLVPIYAFCEGMFLAGISVVFNSMYPGIVPQAVAATFFTLFAMLFLYKVGAVKVTEKFKATILIATAGICLFYLVALITSLFGISSFSSFIMSSSLAGITFTCLVCIVAALNLIVDFSMIEQGAKNGLSKDMEWYGAFALMVTLVWLYVEILRLLSKMNRNN